MLVACLLMTVSLAARAEEPATVSFHGAGFTVSAPPGASFLQVRLMGPSGTLLLDRRTTGDPIEWTLGPGDADGEYSYEALVVMNEDGSLQQRNLPGGFEVQGGLLVVPRMREVADEAEAPATHSHPH